jgi:hypothetical protein
MGWGYERDRAHLSRGRAYPTCPPSFYAEKDPNLVQVGSLQAASIGLWLLTLEELSTTGRVRAFMDHMHDLLSRRLVRSP